MFSVIFVLLPLYYFDWTLRLKRRYFENKIIWTRFTRSDKNMQIRLWRVLVPWASNAFGQREDWHLKRPGSPGDEDGSDVDISLRGNHCATVYGSLNFPWSVSLTFNESTRPVIIKQRAQRCLGEIKSLREESRVVSRSRHVSWAD